MISYSLRKKSVVLFLAVIIMACNINSSGSKNSQQVSSTDTLKTEGCQTGAIKLKVGAILEIKLEAVPGSGYQWLLKDSSQLLKLLDPDSLKFTRPETKEPTPGLPGHQILHFKAVKKGSETLKLEYKRTWETELMNTCEMKIEVSE